MRNAERRFREVGLGEIPVGKKGPVHLRIPDLFPEETDNKM
jgi:hypothetical protein